jgi:hypothetical protein
MTLLQEHLLQLHDRRDRSHHSFLILASSLETGLLGLTLGRIGCGLAELIAMAAASLDHDGSTFDTCRVTANAALLSRWAERLHTNDATRAGCSRGKHQVDTDLSVSLNWLSILDRHPDVQSPAGGQADVSHLVENPFSSTTGAHKERKNALQIMSRRRPSSSPKPVFASVRVC